MKRIISACIAVLALQGAAEAGEITHKLGVTDVPDDPQRVIVLEYSFIDALAAVGEAPVGIADDGNRENVSVYTPYIGDEWTSVGARKTPSFEIMASLSPDLIIADTSRHSGVYEAMSEIAPTIVLDSITGDYFDGLEAMKTIGEALGKETEMSARLEEHEETLNALKAKMQGPENYTAQFGVTNADSLYLHSPTSYVGSLLASFGFKPAMQASEGGTYEGNYVQTSLEQLTEVDPDILIVGEYADPSAVDGWADDAHYQALKAVEAGNVYNVTAHNWSRLRGLIAAEMIAQDVVDVMQKAQ